MSENKYIIGSLFTEPLDADAAGHDTLSGVGTFSLEVYLDYTLFLNSGAKFDLVKTTIATFLAHAIQSTEVPSHAWYFRPIPKIRKNFNLPEVLAMEIKK